MVARIYRCALAISSVCVCAMNRMAHGGTITVRKYV